MQDLAYVHIGYDDYEHKMQFCSGNIKLNKKDTQLARWDSICKIV